MREIRQSGSEGGGADDLGSPYPYQKPAGHAFDKAGWAFYFPIPRQGCRASLYSSEVIFIVYRMSFFGS